MSYLEAFYGNELPLHEKKQLVNHFKRLQMSCLKVVYPVSRYFCSKEFSGSFKIFSYQFQSFFDRKKFLPV